MLLTTVSLQAMSTPQTKRKEDEKEKKFLGRLSYKLDYDFDKNSVSLSCLKGHANQVVLKAAEFLPKEVPWEDVSALSRDTAEKERGNLVSPKVCCRLFSQGNFLALPSIRKFSGRSEGTIFKSGPCRFCRCARLCNDSEKDVQAISQ